LLSANACCEPCTLFVIDEGRTVATAAQRGSARVVVESQYL
jgi:hypothetical protein